MRRPEPRGRRVASGAKLLRRAQNGPPRSPRPRGSRELERNAPRSFLVCACGGDRVFWGDYRGSFALHFPGNLAVSAPSAISAVKPFRTVPTPTRVDRPYGGGKRPRDPGRPLPPALAPRPRPRPFTFRSRPLL